MLGNLHRTEGNLDDAQQAYKAAQTIWLERGQMKTHHFNGACLYKLGCVAHPLFIAPHICIALFPYSLLVVLGF